MHNHRGALEAGSWPIPAIKAAPGLFPFATDMILSGTTRTAAGGPRLSELRRAALAAACASTHARAAGQQLKGRSCASVMSD